MVYISSYTFSWQVTISIGSHLDQRARRQAIGWAATDTGPWRLGWRGRTCRLLRPRPKRTKGGWEHTRLGRIWLWFGTHNAIFGCWWLMKLQEKQIRKKTKPVGWMKDGMREGKDGRRRTTISLNINISPHKVGIQTEK